MDLMQNQHVLHQNRLDARSTLIPAKHEGVCYRNKEESERIVMLTGEYDFRYGDGEWGKLNVPSMWQYHGYGTPRYTNVDYIFPFNPPYVGNHNPIGHYKRKFTLNEKYHKVILHFDGVDSGFFVSVNGKCVGMSKGSRVPAEFDITDYLNVGENELSVDVYTFCDGSYLEAQDMVLASGIFRDVYLICLDRVSLWDMLILPTTHSVTLKLNFDYDGSDGYDVSACIDGQIKTQRISSSFAQFDFEIENPKTWNAETPNLYDLIVKIMHGEETVEVHSKRIGLREVEIIDNKLSLNGRPIKLKGVNRHEYTPDNGRAIDYKTTYRELKLLKDNNINAIRCCHYPNTPFFYDIANELGFYVMDEADLETHGCHVTGDQGYLSKNPDWLDAYLDRQKRMYERDKNETCIVIWSLGNESGKGENLVKCAEYMRSVDVKKPILYPQDDCQDPQFTDFRQVGYCSLTQFYLRHEETGTWFKHGMAPIIATEFAHSMGNGPGIIYDSFEKMLTLDSYAGGFVWEFKNHGIKRGGDYLYGGDFGENNHSANFNLDGICLSDGTPKPVMTELREAVSPVMLKYDDGVIVRNTNDFRNLSYLRLDWELVENFTVIDSGVREDIDVPAHECRLINIPYRMPEVITSGKSYYLNLKFTDKETGTLVSLKQIKLPYGSPKTHFEPEKFSHSIKDGEIVGENFKVRFSGGVISRYEKDGKTILDKPMGFSFYRKPTDNDGIKGKRENIIKEWSNALLMQFEYFEEECEIHDADDCVTVTTMGKILPEGKFVGYVARIVYRVFRDGVISCDIEASPYGNMPGRLPREGVVFELDGKYKNVVWYGRGEHQNYDDLKNSALFGLYRRSVHDMNFMFDRPQETGNRSDTFFAALTDDNGTGLLVLGADKFSFSTQDYTMDALMRAEHRTELEYCNTNYFRIDYRMRGLGSASCGPHPDLSCELNPRVFEMSFIIKAFEGVEDAEKYHGLDFGVHSQTKTTSYKYTPPVTARENFESKD